MSALRTQITTIIGALIAIFGLISQPEIMNLIPAKYGAMITTLGGILTVLGRSLLAPTNSPSGVTAASVTTSVKVAEVEADTQPLEKLPPVG